MGQSEYGLYSLVASIVAYLTVLDMGFGNAVVRYTAKFRAEGKVKELYSLFGLFILLYSCIALIAFLIGLVLYFNLGVLFDKTLNADELSKAQTMILLLVFNIAITFPLSVFGSIIVGYENFIFQKVVVIFRQILQPLIMIPLLLLGYGAVSLVVVITLLNIFCLLLNCLFCVYNLKVRIYFRRMSLQYLHEIFGFSMFLFIIFILDKFYWNTGQFVLGMYSGTLAVAVYAIAMQIKNCYLAFSTAIANVFLPKITTMISNGTSMHELSDIFIRIGRIQFHIVGFILCGFILFGKQFIYLWAGRAYEEAYYIALLIMIPFTIPLIQSIGPIILESMNKLKFRCFVYLITSFVTLGLSFYLGKKFSGIGCAIAISSAVCVGEILMMNWFYSKKIKLNIVLFWKHILGLFLYMLPFIIFSLIVKDEAYSHDMLLFGLKILIYSISYLIFAWIWGFNIYEKELLINSFKKIVLLIKNNRKYGE